MAAAANNPDFAKRAGIPQSVASEFHEADKRGMYEGGLAPMTRVEEGKGGLGGLGATVQNFKFGGSSYVGNWDSRKHKDLRLLDIMAPWRGDLPKKIGKKERKRRTKAERQQERGRWGDEILTDVKNPRKRRALVRAGWIADTPPDTRKGIQGAKGKKGKKYAADLNKHTVFYPPQSVGTAPGGAGPAGEYLANLRPGLTGGQPYVPPTNIYSTYIAPGGAEGGAVGYQEGGAVSRTWAQIPGDSSLAKMLWIAQMSEQGWTSDKPAGKGVDIKSLIWYPPQATILGDSGIPGQDASAGRRGRRGGRGGGRRRPPVGQPFPEGDPGDRIIPPGRLPPGGGLVPPTATPYTPPDRRAGRDTDYSRALLEHRARLEQILGSAEGGAVSRYQEGGEVKRPGHAEGPNPYPEGSARWKVWERKHHVDPAPPPQAKAEEEEDTGWFSGLFKSEEDRRTRTERELEEMEQARGGPVGFQLGGYARAPMGRVPPMGALQQVTGGSGRPAMRPPMMTRRMPMKPAGYDPRGGPITPPPGKEPFVRGGPQVPPNMRGYLQRAMMMNRPRRGIPGPAGAGGAPNRVGQSDQQGGLARALQRGTGRPPMSRRQGFYR